MTVIKKYMGRNIQKDNIKTYKDYLKEKIAKDPDYKEYVKIFVKGNIDKALKKN